MHDVIVVSDLHLSRGKNPATGRFHRLEAFFYDEDFASFCSHLITDAHSRHVGLKLVLNGDTFDLLRIDHEREPGQSLRERRYGPVLTPDSAAETMHMILAGHPAFVEALARVLLAGHQVVFNPGNHDPELQWTAVQEVVREVILDAVAALADAGARSSAESRLIFEQWFHYEPGRIWIEHGCQYDSENSFRYPLRRTFAELPDSHTKGEIDVPLGTFFQKYLYNGFGNITFLVPNSRSNVRYFRWLLVNRPRLLAKVARQQVPFFLQVLRRIAKAAASTEELEQCHQRELDELAERSGLGDDLREIDNLKEVHGATLLAERILSRTFKVSLYVMLIGLLSAGLYFAGVQSISELTTGFGWKTLLFLALNFTFLLVVIGLLAYYLLRPPGAPPDPGPRRAARRIAEQLDVPLITFGHTHEESINRIDRPGGDASWYFNTGTWIAVFTHDELLPRERVQYTFLRVRDTSGELMHWSPGRGEPVPVILLEDDRKYDPVRPSGPPAT